MALMSTPPAQPHVTSWKPVRKAVVVCKAPKERQHKPGLFQTGPLVRHNKKGKKKKKKKGRRKKRILKRKHFFRSLH